MPRMNLDRKRVTFFEHGVGNVDRAVAPAAAELPLSDIRPRVVRPSPSIPAPPMSCPQRQHPAAVGEVDTELKETPLIPAQLAPTGGLCTCLMDWCPGREVDGRPTV